MIIEFTCWVSIAYGWHRCDYDAAAIYSSVERCQYHHAFIKRHSAKVDRELNIHPKYDPTNPIITDFECKEISDEQYAVLAAQWVADVSKVSVSPIPPTPEPMDYWYYDAIRTEQREQPAVTLGCGICKTQP